MLGEVRVQTFEGSHENPIVALQRAGDEFCPAIELVKLRDGTLCRGIQQDPEIFNRIATLSKQVGVSSNDRAFSDASACLLIKREFRNHLSAAIEFWFRLYYYERNKRRQAQADA